MDGLDAIFDELEQKAIKMKRINSVRWLSRYQAVHAVAIAYDALLKFLQQESDALDPAATGILRELKKERWVCMQSLQCKLCLVCNCV